MWVVGLEKGNDNMDLHCNCKPQAIKANEEYTCSYIQKWKQVRHSTLPWYFMCMKKINLILQNVPVLPNLLQHPIQEAARKIITSQDLTFMKDIFQCIMLQIIWYCIPNTTIISSHTHACRKNHTFPSKTQQSLIIYRLGALSVASITMSYLGY